MNCSHEAASRLSPSTGWKPSLRVSNSRLTVRGFGLSRIVWSVSWRVCSMGTLRPKGVPALPIQGSFRSLYVPSGVRAVR